MPRELAEAPAPAMRPPVAAVSYKSLLQMVMKPDLQAKVIAAWVVWIVLRQLQSILGPMRRRSRHWLVQYGAMAAYYLPTLIAFYTANAVYSTRSSFKVILVIGCSALLYSCARGAVTMTAFTLANGPLRLQSWRLIPWLLYFAWLQWGVVWGDRKLTVSDVYYFTVVCIVPILYVVLAKPRAALLDFETKEYADYMVRESRSSSPFFFFLHGDPNSLHDCCKYPFEKLSNGRWMRFNDLLRVLGRLPRDCAVDPDTCLSYIFSRLLARRYFGFPCAEDGNAQVRDFVLKELLADCNRGFTIVEVQLALLHDYFFTNYYAEINSGFVSVKKGIVNLLCLSLFFIGCFAAGYLINGGYKAGLSTLVTRLISSGLPICIIYIIIYQPEFPFLPRYWHPVRNLIMNYSTAATGNPPVIDRSAAPLSRQSSRVSYWREKMGQYSVLEDYDRRSSKKAIIAWCKVHVLSQASYSFMKHHPAEEEDVSVPDSLRRLLALTIRGLNGLPTIGARLLKVQGNNRAQLDDLSWTCRQDTLTHTILIWHLATCYCDMSQPLEEDPSNGGYRNDATTLSRYCAYLVAFLPELLPEHSLTTKVVLQQVLQESRDLLGKTRMSMDAKISRIQQIQLPEHESSLTTFHKGVRLGQHLRRLGVSLRWKTMAYFWAEMILYIASSSGNATAHIEQLAQGGEFITHLWALLCNAGISRSEAGNRGITDPTQA